MAKPIETFTSSFLHPITETLMRGIDPAIKATGRALTPSQPGTPQLPAPPPPALTPNAKSSGGTTNAQNEYSFLSAASRADALSSGSTGKTLIGS
jgi:hypothetical protein